MNIGVLTMTLQELIQAGEEAFTIACGGLKGAITSKRIAVGAYR